MRIIYLLLSPTFGMHQYTADLANRMAAAGHDVHLVTTTHAPRDRYSPQVQIHTPLSARTTGFAPEGLDLPALRRVLHALTPSPLSPSLPLPSPLTPSLPLPLSPSPPPPLPPLVHITGVHLWNPALLRSLRRRGVPTVHTLHDLDPHLGVRFGRLIRLWNRAVLANADQILVHGQAYRQRLLREGLAPDRITYDAAFASIP